MRAFDGGGPELGPEEKKVKYVATPALMSVPAPSTPVRMK
jgi:hypothetical protein